MVSTERSTEQLLDSAGVEKLLCLGSGDGAALAVARHRKAIDIPFIPVGKNRIRYRLSDVLAWIEKHTVRPAIENNTVKPTRQAKTSTPSRRRSRPRLKKSS